MPAPMPCGMLRFRATVERALVTRSPTGQAVETWCVVANAVPCHIEQAEDSDVIRDQGVSVATRWRIVAAWCAAITAKARLRIHDGRCLRTLHVESVADPDRRMRRMEIQCTEVQA